MTSKLIMTEFVSCSKDYYGKKLTGTEGYIMFFMCYKFVNGDYKGRAQLSEWMVNSLEWLVVPAMNLYHEIFAYVPPSKLSSRPQSDVTFSEPNIPIPVRRAAGDTREFA